MYFACLAASMGQRTPGETVGSSAREAKTHDRRRRRHRHHHVGLSEEFVGSIVISGCNFF